eukprot:m.748121 g.748121  ORF g.748121 m.748121 type:complete len:192 (+) comp58970_c1_seq18:463-1038(+)
MTSRIASFESAVSTWLQLVRETAPSPPILLAGNKTDEDSRRVVSTDEGRAFAAANGFMFVETSALTGANVEAAFQKLVLGIFREQAPGDPGSINFGLTKLLFVILSFWLPSLSLSSLLNFSFGFGSSFSSRRHIGSCRCKYDHHHRCASCYSDRSNSINISGSKCSISTDSNSGFFNNSSSCSEHHICTTG